MKIRVKHIKDIENNVMFEEEFEHFERKYAGKIYDAELIEEGPYEGSYRIENGIFLANEIDVIEEDETETSKGT